MNIRATRTRALLAGLSAIALLAPLAACGSSSTGANTAGSAVLSADASTADLTATIKVGTPSPSSILDPAKQNNIGQNTFTSLIYDSLTQMDSNYQIQPMLATVWEFEDDGSTLTMQLREDVEFNDGTPFDASAVKVNIERGKNMPGSALVSTLDSIDDVIVVDDYEVKFTLKPGLGAELPAVFALNGGMMVSPKAIAERESDLVLNPQNAGSGPYLPVKVDAGKEVVFDRNPNYWNKDTALAQTLVMRTASDHAARINGVRTGDLDVAQISASSSVQESLALIASGAFEGDMVTQATPVVFIPNAERGDLTKPEIRKAIALAVDKEAMVNGLFDGNAVVADQFYPDFMWAHDPNFNSAPAYDAEKAKALVKEVGGAEITIAAATGSSAEPVAQALQDQLQSVGIKVNLQSIPFEQIDDTFRRGELDGLVVNASPQSDPASTLSYYVTDGFKAARGHGDALDVLEAEAANPALSQEARAAKYFEIWQIMAEENMWVPIVRGNQVWVRNDKIANVPALQWVRSGFPYYGNVAKVN